MSEAVDIVRVDASRAQQLMQERSEAEAEAQSAPQEILPNEGGAPNPSAAPSPGAAEGGEEAWTEEGHRMVVGLVCEVPPMFGGERVPAEVEAQVASLTMPASKKYGGNLPYAAELMALAGLGLLVRYAFWPPGAPDKVERLQAQQEQLRAQQAEEREAEERAASKWDAPE